MHQALDLGDHGTCVTVNDLFGNMPVRVKSRALALERLDELEREWDNMRYLLVSLMLANDRLSKLVLSDAARSKKIVIRLGTPSPKHALVGQNEGELNLKRISSILAQSGMVNFRDLDSWHTLSASVPDLTIRAVISLLPSPTKRVQFISLGIKSLFWRNSSNVLFDEINRLFVLSDFGQTRVADDGSARWSLPDRSDAPSGASVQSGTRPVNKRPMFYIRIDTSSARELCDEGYESFPEYDKSVQRITDVLGAMIHEFLKQHNLRPRAKKGRGKMSDRAQQTSAAYQKDTGSITSAKRRDLVSTTEEAFSGRLKLPSLRRSTSTYPGQSFDNWSRIKAAKEPTTSSAPQLQDEMPSGKEKADRDKEVNPSLLDASTGLKSSKATSEISPLLDMAGNDDNVQPEVESSGIPTDKVITWIDPRTGKNHLSNARTGQTIAPFFPALRPRSTGFVTATSKLGSIHRPQSAPTSTQSLWVDNLLKTWDNPVFRRTEKPISSVDMGANRPSPAGLPSHNCFRSIGSLNNSHVAKFRGKLWGKGLETAEVIAQVDRKFILAKVSATPLQCPGDCNSEDALVLIDQHAADERCRIEQLFQELFEPAFSTESGDQVGRVRSVKIEPIMFEVSSAESALFRKYLDFFGDWGVHYETESRYASAASVSVRSLPILIAERCRLEPDLVIDLVRREIWTREEDGSRPLGLRNMRAKEPFGSQVMCLSDEEDLLPTDTRGQAGSSSASWVHRLSGCPQSLIDLLNSRACRSAIMFNDSLSIEECQALVSRLARCAFPFQCAHGRPSMIPILDLRSLADASGFSYLDIDDVAPDYVDDSAGISFMEAFRARYTG